MRFTRHKTANNGMTANSQPDTEFSVSTLTFDFISFHNRSLLTRLEKGIVFLFVYFSRPESERRHDDMKGVQSYPHDKIGQTPADPGRSRPTRMTRLGPESSSCHTGIQHPELSRCLGPYPARSLPAYPCEKHSPYRLELHYHSNLLPMTL